MANALHQIGPDGLFYWPFSPGMKAPDWGAGYCTGKTTSGRRSTIPCPFFAQAIGAMSVYLLRDPDGPWTVKSGRSSTACGAWPSIGATTPGSAGRVLPGPAAREERSDAGRIWSSLPGWTVQGLAQYYRASGYEPARDLAGSWPGTSPAWRFYGPAGEFLPNFAGEDGGRVPDTDGIQASSRHGKLEGIHPFPSSPDPAPWHIEYALTANDGTWRSLSPFLRMARKKGNVTVGYFPENIDRVNERQTSSSAKWRT